MNLRKFVLTFLMVLSFFIFTGAARAEELEITNEDFIQSVDLSTTINGSLFIKNPDADPFYLDQENTYTEDSATYVFFDHTNSVVNPYNINFLVDVNALNGLAGIKTNYKQIKFYFNGGSSCSEKNETFVFLSGTNIIDSHNSIGQLSGLDDCPRELFTDRDGDGYGAEFTVKASLIANDGTEYKAKGPGKKYRFQLLPRAQTTQCTIEFSGLKNQTCLPSTGVCTGGGADVDSDITVVVNDIDSLSYGAGLYQDDVIIDGDNSCVAGSGCRPSLNEPNHTKYIGKLSAKPSGYMFSVKRHDPQKTIMCARNLPVVASGEDLIPPGENLDATSATLTLELATTVPLCESIPADADCNGTSCRLKCQACEDAKGVWTGIGCLPTNFAGLISSLFTTFAGILGALIFFCVVSNGIKIMMSRGNPEALKKGTEAITACIVGFVVLALSILFLRIVGVNILQLPGWS